MLNSSSSLREREGSSNALLPIHSHLPRLRRFGGFAPFYYWRSHPSSQSLAEEGNSALLEFLTHLHADGVHEKAIAELAPGSL